MQSKFIIDKSATALMFLATIVVLGFFASIILAIARVGAPVLTWQMVSELPQGGFYLGGEGGILNAIVGSLMVVGGSTAIGLLVSIPIVFYKNIYLGNGRRLAYYVRLSFDVLYGIPSIVYGAFAFTLMILLGMKTSLLGGILVTTFLIVPIFICSMDEVAQSVPRDLLEASYSLGATKLETCRLVLRQIAPGVATATLLSIGRAIGDAAGVLFTAGFTDDIPTALDRPAATLPLSVFFQLSSPVPEVRERAYAAALLLTIIVLILSLLGRWLTARFSKTRG